MVWRTGLVVVIAACGSVKEPTCAPGTADCNGDPKDGCETDLASVMSCGACGNVCMAPNGAAPACSTDTCTFTCGGGLVACGTQCLARCDQVFETPGQSTYEVPASCTRLRVKAWGAGGANGQGNTVGAAGGFGVVELAVHPRDTFVVVVGAPGNALTGGMPGGGNGGTGSSQSGGGGGGYSGLFIAKLQPDQAIVIAGGGGGSGGGTAAVVAAGAGGGTMGENGAALGGTQTTGFAALGGGPGGSQNQGDGGGGGGGGWFGGQGGKGANSDAGGGGGGAGFAAPQAMLPLLASGTRGTPGGATDPDRGTAGEPGHAGKVVIDCIP